MWKEAASAEEEPEGGEDGAEAGAEAATAAAGVERSCGTTAWGARADTTHSQKERK